MKVNVVAYRTVSTLLLLTALLQASSGLPILNAPSHITTAQLGQIFLDEGLPGAAQRIQTAADKRLERLGSALEEHVIDDAGVHPIGTRFGGFPQEYRSTRLLLANIQFSLGAMLREAHLQELQNAKTAYEARQQLSMLDTLPNKWLSFLIRQAESLH
ncbi:hypothetical protein BCV70DRAFT_216148 [Testicularia cyperi]|uniref:Uncharacterized protein n=1 Tax=Testicularia cyperi TaxID=1882483 RepID=A0A317XWM6_9BASI|nr:hypothetical protein BCV70DRAFT_216148 [Testicularia cyperi]